MSDNLFQLLINLGGERHEVLVVTAWDKLKYSETGHSYIDVQARLIWTDARGQRRGHIVFKRGDTWCGVNRWTSTDGKEARHLVLSLLAMRPGDTDPGYFAGYTHRQLTFAELHGDALRAIADERYGEQ